MKPTPASAIFVILSTAAFAIAYGGGVLESVERLRPGPLAVTLVIFQTAVEVAVSAYLFLYLFWSVAYLLNPARTSTDGGDLVSGAASPGPLDESPAPPVAILYL